MNSRTIVLLAALTAVSSAFASSSAAVSEIAPRRSVALTAPILFSVLDLDHDGVLSPVEQAHAAITLRALDTDGDGVITSAEMAGPARVGAVRRAASMAVSAVSYRPASDLNLMIRLDANHDGVIQPLELANATSSLRDLDSNQDGVVTRDEV